MDIKISTNEYLYVQHFWNLQTVLLGTNCFIVELVTKADCKRAIRAYVAIMKFHTSIALIYAVRCIP